MSATSVITKKFNKKEFGARTAPSSLYGSGGGKSGGGGSTEASNSLFSNSLALLTDVISEGPIGGLKDGARSIFLNDVPLLNSNGSYNFNGVEWEHRIGEETQAPSEILDAVEVETSVNVEVTVSSGPVTRVVADADVDGFRVRLRFPALYKVTDEGDILSYAVRFRIQWSPSGTGSWQDIPGSTFELSGKNNSPTFRDYEYLPPTAGPWDVRVIRDSPDDDSAKKVSAFYFDAIVSVLKQKMIYPWSALVNFRIDASQFGSSVPKRTYLVSGRIIRVPTNYDPVARTYTGFWDGTFKMAVTDNPAWIFLDMFTNTRYGAGRPDNEIDMAALYEIAQYCDGMVPDGKGGFEPRWTINICINTAQDAYTMFNQMVSAFRGMYFWSGGQWSFSADMPTSELDYLATPANTEYGVFNYQSTSDKSRANYLYVQYNNPNDGDAPDFEIVEDNDDIIERGPVTKKITAWGCRSQGMARRVGKWELYTLHNDTEIVSYVAGTDHALVLPGNIIGIADPTKTGKLAMGGKIKQVLDYDQLMLDRPLSLAMPQTYSIALINTDGRTKYYNVIEWTSDPITGNAIAKLDQEFDGTVQINSVYAVYRTSANIRKYRVTAVGENKGRREISALLYNPSKFPYIETDEPLDTPPSNVGAEEFLGAPRNFSYTPTQVTVPGSEKRIDVLYSWTEPVNQRLMSFYRLQFADDTTSPVWITVYEGRDTSFIQQGLSSVGLKAARVQCVGVNGEVSIWITISNIELSSRLTPPPPPQMFSAAGDGSGLAAVLTWQIFDTPDFEHVEIWRGVTPDSGSAARVGISTTDSYRDANLVNGTDYFYWIRTSTYTSNSSVKYSTFVGPLMVRGELGEASVLDGSITAAKIADAAVTASKLLDGAVTGLKIAADSIAAIHMAAGSVTAKSLILTDFTNFVKNWDFADISTDSMNAIWNFGADVWTITNPGGRGVYPEIGGALIGENQIVLDRGTSGGAQVAVSSKDFLPVSGGENLSWETAARTGSSATTAGFSLIFFWFDAAKTPLSTPFTFAFEQAAVPSSYGALLRGKTPVPAGARYFKVDIRHSPPSSVPRIIVDRISVRRANAAELIVDGTIIAGHLATDSVVSTKIAAGAITTAKLAAGAVTADKITVTDLAAINANLGSANISNAIIGTLIVGNSNIANGAVTGIGSGTTSATVFHSGGAEAVFISCSAIAVWGSDNYSNFEVIIAGVTVDNFRVQGFSGQRSAVTRTYVHYPGGAGSTSVAFNFNDSAGMNISGKSITAVAYRK